jgi:predicted  nucleic acid-binding Zn-ribbon protein
MLLRDADIAKLMGLAQAQIQMKQAAAAAATEAATIAGTDPSKQDIADSMASKESIIQKLEEILHNKNTNEEQKKKLENEIARLKQELIDVGKNLELQHAISKLELLQKEKDDLQKKIDEENSKKTPNEDLLKSLQTEMNALNTAIESIGKEIAKIKEDIANNKAINEDGKNKESLLERLKADLKAPPISVSINSMLGIAGVGLAAIVGAVGLGGLLANLPNIGGKTDALECSIGKLAALTAAAENVKSIAKTAYERGKQWGDANNEAGGIGEASDLPSVPEFPGSDESEPGPEAEGEAEAEVEGEVEGEVQPEEVIQDGGADEEDAQIESDITQEKTAEEDGADEEDDGSGDAGNFPDLSALKIPGSFTSGASGNLTSDDTAIPDSVLKSIHFVWLYSPAPKILKFTFGRLPSNTAQTCFKDQLKTYLNPIWTQVFTAGAKGLPKPPVSATGSFPDLSPDSYEEEQEEQEDQEDQGEDQGENNDSDARQKQESDNRDSNAIQKQVELDGSQEGGSKRIMYH